MRLFHLYRVEDQSGVSGTGPVVEGVEFTNGWCVIRWLSDRSTIGFYTSINDIRAIHGHGGKTELVVHEFPPPHRQQPASMRFELFLETLEEISRTVQLAEDGEITAGDIHQSMEHIKKLLDTLEERLGRELKTAS